MEKLLKSVAEALRCKIICLNQIIQSVKLFSPIYWSRVLLFLKINSTLNLMSWDFWEIFYKIWNFHEFFYSIFYIYIHVKRWKYRWLLVDFLLLWLYRLLIDQCHGDWRVFKPKPLILPYCCVFRTFHYFDLSCLYLEIFYLNIILLEEFWYWIINSYF